MKAGLSLFACWAGLLITWQIVTSSNRDQPGANSTQPAKVPEKGVAEGLENLWSLPVPDGQSLLCGGQPQGEAGFQSLKLLGVRSVISVDGARPDVETAKRLGLEYVHLPIGYDDVPVERRIELIQAARVLPGGIYVHCHHGKHRGPAAAVCLWRSLNPIITADHATETLRVIGTAEKYRGLYRAVAQPLPHLELIDAQVFKFPEVSAVRPLAEDMVAIDHDWEQLQRYGKQASLTEDQSQQVNALLAGLAERFRESARLLESEVETSTNGLRDSLAQFSGEIQPVGEIGGNHAILELLRTELQRLKPRCAACHSKYRD